MTRRTVTVELDLDPGRRAEWPADELIRVALSDALEGLAVLAGEGLRAVADAITIDEARVFGLEPVR